MNPLLFHQFIVSLSTRINREKCFFRRHKAREPACRQQPRPPPPVFGRLFPPGGALHFAGVGWVSDGGTSVCKSRHHRRLLLWEEEKKLSTAGGV